MSRPLEDLVSGTLLLPTPDPSDQVGTWILVEREVLSVLMVDDDAGLMMPAFTSPDALFRWQPDGGTYVQRDSSWVFGVASADESGRVVIDPGSPTSVILGRSDIDALATGASPGQAETTGSAGQVLIATPIDGLPEGLAAAARAAMAAEPAVVSAQLFSIDQGQGSRPMVLVDLSGGLDSTGVGAVMSGIVGRIADQTEDAAGLTFLVVTSDWRSTYESGGIEIYRR